MAKIKSAESPKCNTGATNKDQWWNMNYMTLAPQTRPSGEILNYSLSRYFDILSMIIGLDENNRAECVTVLELCISGMLWAIHLPRLAVHSSSQPIVLATFLTINTTTNLPAQLKFSVTDTSNQPTSISSLKFTFCACLHIQVQNNLKGHWLLETLNHENQFWLMSIYLFKISVC